MNPGTLLLPAGTYVIGDPCYLLREDDPLQAEVSRLVSTTDQDVAPFHGGALLSTGDGMFSEPSNREPFEGVLLYDDDLCCAECMVDSGQVVIIPLPVWEAEERGLAPWLATFTEPFSVVLDKRDGITLAIEAGPLVLEAEGYDRENWSD